MAPEVMVQGGGEVTKGTRTPGEARGTVWGKEVDHYWG